MIFLHPLFLGSGKYFYNLKGFLWFKTERNPLVVLIYSFKYNTSYFIKSLFGKLS